jgi:starch synthase
VSPPADLSVALLTREYPPDVYGGAGVHVEYLARELARLVDVTVHAWGEPRPDASPPVVAYSAWKELAGSEPYTAALQTMSIDLLMAERVAGADVLHSHTWYANLAGHLGGLVHDVPHVATVHSLEPRRPWKAEQLGGGYAVSCFCERAGLEGADAIIAVSKAMRRDIVETYPRIDSGRVVTISNGIDTDQYRCDPETDRLEQLGIDPEIPSVVFVGRITRQKGLPHLLTAARLFEAGTQLVLCAGSPDTPELALEVAEQIEELRASGRSVVWIEAMLPRPDLIQILSHASVFVCPSVYEPLGIVNLEAMACERPVVASAVGGIPEVVEDEFTGLLVPLDLRSDGSGEPVDPAGFARDFAERVNRLLVDPAEAERFGRAGRQRAVEEFSWRAIAEQVVEIYRAVL